MAGNGRLSALLAATLAALACNLTRAIPTPELHEASPPPMNAPTPRPLAQVAVEPGRYRNDVLGVSLDYPVEWEVLLSEEAQDGLLVVRSQDQAVVVVLWSYVLYAGETLGQFVSEFYRHLPVALGLSSSRDVENEPTYRLADGSTGVRLVGEGRDATGDWLQYDIVATERSGRLFLLTILASRESQDEQAEALNAIRGSLRLYPPRPFGVDRSNALFLADEEPETFDPARWRGSADGMIGDLFSGLVRLDASLQPIPDLAESWEVSQDGTRYTFRLRRNVVFHNGDPFTGHDVVFSWERAARPETGSETVLTYLGDIVGVRQVAVGSAQHIEGVRLLDDYTLEVTLDGPKPYFLAKLAYPTSWIVNPSSVERIEEEPIGTGPFTLARHIENQVVIMARNPRYHLGPVSLEYVVYLLYPGPLIRLYEVGDLDLTYVDEDLLSRATDPQDPLYGNVYRTSELCTRYVALDVRRPPFQDRLVRRAFAMAVDRERYVAIVGEGRGVAANGLYPPGLPGYDPGVRPMPYDPAQARQLLEQSAFSGPDGLPEIIFTVSGAGQDLPPSAAVLVQMWQEALDVSVRVEQIDSRSFYDQVYAGNHGQMLLTGWCADYPDPENFADVLFHSGSRQNFGGYGNPEVDELLERARVEPEVARRLALYREIEQRLIDDAAAIFLEHAEAYYTVVKPHVQGYVSTPIGIAQHMNLWIAR